jgi:hypothetical protein
MNRRHCPSVWRLTGGANGFLRDLRAKDEQPCGPILSNMRTEIAEHVPRTTNGIETASILDVVITITTL